MVSIYREEIMGENELVWIGSSIDVAAKKCGLFEARRRFTLEKVQLLSILPKPFRKPSTVFCRIPPMGLANVSMVAPFLAGLYSFFENRNEFGKLAKIADFELKIWEFSKIAAFPYTGNFSTK